MLKQQNIIWHEIAGCDNETICQGLMLVMYAKLGYHGHLCLFDAQDHQSCYEACRTASTSLRDMPQTLNALRIAARCLYLRQLLSETAKAELSTLAPAASGLLSHGKQHVDPHPSLCKLHAPPPPLSPPPPSPQCPISTLFGFTVLETIWVSVHRPSYVKFC